MKAAPSAEPAQETPVPEGDRRSPAWMRWGLQLWHLSVGAVLVQSFLGALVVLGWTQKAVQRSVLRAWWRRRPGSRGHLTFERFCSEDAATSDMVSDPNWFLGRPSGNPGGFRGLPRRLLGGLFSNLRCGVVAAFGMFLLVGPGELLWSVSWYAGWQNSFNKGYEHAVVGPLVFILGLLLFSFGMLVLPLAATRLAVTGRFRTMLQWRRLWNWSARRWAASAMLAMLIAAAGGLSLVAKTLPGFFPQMAESRILRLEKAGEEVPSELRESASPSRGMALAVLRRYHFRWALVLFPVFVGVRILAGRHYAATVLDGVRSGMIGEEDLEESEWHVLRRLDLITPRPAAERPRWRRFAAWLGTRSGRISARMLTFGVWMFLGVLILVSEFLRYSGGGGGAPGRGWWNQPMIQVPWFNWTPGHLREQEASEP
jgi:hypothetical protein